VSVTDAMQLIMLLIIFSGTIHRNRAVQIGIVHNASLILRNTLFNTINALTCENCLCSMQNMSENSSIVSLNCYTQYVNGVICELFTKTNYQNSSDYQIVVNASSIFYFLELPPTVTQHPLATTTTTTTTSVSTTASVTSK